MLPLVAAPLCFLFPSSAVTALLSLVVSFSVLQAEEEEKEGDDEASNFVDVTAPHPEFVLSPPNTRVSSREFEDICEDLAPPSGKGELKNSQHPFLRALRRGALEVVVSG